MQPGETFQKLLKENNLKISLAPQTVKRVEDGSLIIEIPQLLVDWEVATQAPVVEPAPVTPEPAPMPVEQPAQVPTATEVAPEPGKELSEPTV